MILHLGVEDFPYATPPRRKPKQSVASQVTTGDVAGWLEDRYHIMEIFFRENEQDVADAVGESLSGAIETLLMGGPATLSAFGSAESAIDDALQGFLARGDMERLGYPGVPTQAARDRASGKKRSARFKRRRATGASVSFVDSGLYMASVKAWID